MKQFISSEYSNEDDYGYSRALRAGNTIYVSGTTARDLDLQKDAFGQSEAILNIIKAALTELGATFDDVVRTVVYIRSMDDEALVAKAHSKAFRIARPASTLVEVTGLTPPEALVEFEVTAVVEDPGHVPGL